MALQALQERGIVKTSGTCGGSPRVDGTRIRVVDIMGYYRTGKAPEEIADTFRASIDLGDVHAAIAYYYKHLDEMKKEEEERKRIIEEARKRHPSKLRAKSAFAEKNREILRLVTKKHGITKEQMLEEWDKIRHSKF